MSSLPPGSVVLVSYRHEAGHPDHAPRVAGLVARLRHEGFSVAFDQDHPPEGADEDWYLWMQKAVEQAAAFVVVWTPGYREAWYDPNTSRSRGVAWEATLLRARMGDKKIDRRAVLCVSALGAEPPGGVFREPYYALDDLDPLVERLRRYVGLAPRADFPADLYRALCGLFRKLDAIAAGDAVDSLVRGLSDEKWRHAAAKALLRRTDDLFTALRDIPGAERAVAAVELPLTLADAVAEGGNLPPELLARALEPELSHRPDRDRLCLRHALLCIGQRATDDFLGALGRVASRLLDAAPGAFDRGPVERWLARNDATADRRGDLQVLWWHMRSPSEVGRAGFHGPGGKRELPVRTRPLCSADDAEDLLLDCADRIGAPADRLILQLELFCPERLPDLALLEGLDTRGLSVWPCEPYLGQEHRAPIRAADVVVIARREGKNTIRSQPGPALLALAPAWAPAAEPCPVTTAHTWRTLTVLHPAHDEPTARADLFAGAPEAGMGPIFDNLRKAAAEGRKSTVLWTDPRYRPTFPEDAEYV